MSLPATALGGWHHVGARHRTPVLGEGEAQEHTWAPCEHLHHSFSSRACQDACSVSDTAGAVSLQLGRNSVALSHCRRAQGPRSSHKALLNLPDSASPLTSHIQTSPSPPRLSVFSPAATAISGQDTSLYTTIPHTHCWAFDFTGLHSLNPSPSYHSPPNAPGALCTCWVLCLECL